MTGRTPLPREAFATGDAGVLWVAHCSEGPVPRPAVEAMRAFLRREERPWEISWEDDFIGRPAAVRREGARLFAGREQDVTLTATTSSGLALIAGALDWREGDEVVLPLGEFPANLWPWLALRPLGVRVTQVPLWPGHRAGAEAWESAPPPSDVDPESALLDAVGPRTRLVAASWVRFQDGLRLDVARLGSACARRGVPLVIDAIQGAGTLPWPGGASAAACGGHKGLLAPQGLGLLWTAPRFRERLRPCGSWLSVEQATDFSRPSTDVGRAWLADGRRFEQGVPNLVGCAGLASSLKLINDAGPERIADHVARLQARLLDRLDGTPAWSGEVVRLRALARESRLGPILALHHGGRGPGFLDRLLAAGAERRIHASVREGYLRVAFHGWHDEEDADRVAEWLASS